MRARDYQRSRCYAAERKARELLGSKNRSFETVQDIQNELENFKSRKEFLEQFKDCQIRVKDGRGRRRPCCEIYSILSVMIPNFTLKFPKWSRNALTVMHELTHTQIAVDLPWHGATFCQKLLQLIELYMGKEARDVLQQCYDEYSVRYDTE